MQDPQRIVERLEDLEQKLQSPPNPSKLVYLIDGVRLVLRDLRTLESELWTQLHDEPWNTYRNLAHSVAWIDAAEEACDFAEQRRQGATQEAIAALNGGVNLAYEGLASLTTLHLCLRQSG